MWEENATASTVNKINKYNLKKEQKLKTCGAILIYFVKMRKNLFI